MIHQQLCSRFRGAEIDARTAWTFDTIEAISIGTNVIIGPFSEIVVLKTCDKSSVEGSLHIGNNVCIGAGCNIRAAGGAIKIGANSMIAQHVSIIASSHTFKVGQIYSQLAWNQSKTGVTIGSNCWIGAGVVFLPGVHINENSVIAAGSVVTRDVPSNEVWARVPAVKIADVRP
jgi:acetyltransferase-like isoleucine patch superfamily enzyme